MTYAQIEDSIVVNLLSFNDEPSKKFLKLTGMKLILVPSDLPVGIDDTWGGEMFLSKEGHEIKPIEELVEIELEGGD